MKIFSCYTPAHEVLWRDFFLPSLPPAFEARATPIELAGPGDFDSPDYLECLFLKMRLIIQSLGDHPGEVLVWSDVDIVFYHASAGEIARTLEESGKDLLFQREHLQGDRVNPGFMVCRATPAVLDFYQRVLARMKMSGQRNDQPVINDMLKAGAGPSWGLLPAVYYARSHGWPPPRDLAIYHANVTTGKDGVGQKIRQFQDMALLRKHPLRGNAWIRFKRIPGRLRRMWSEARGG